MQKNQNFLTNEARAAPFYKIEQVLIESKIFCFLTRDDRINFIGNVSLSTNPTYIGLLLSNAIVLSYVQSSTTGKQPCLPVPLQMFMTPTVENAYVFCTKKTGSAFSLGKKEYDEFCKKINHVQRTIKMVQFQTAKKRFWEFLQIYEWYIKKIDGSCFTLNQEFKKYQVKLQKNNKGIIETFDSLSEWCLKANASLKNKFSSQNTFEEIIGVISDNDNKHESQKDEKEKKVLAEKNDEEDAEKEDENHEEDYKKVEEEDNDEEDDEEMGEEHESQKDEKEKKVLAEKNDEEDAEKEDENHEEDYKKVEEEDNDEEDDEEMGEEDDKSFEEENEKVVEDNGGDEELSGDDEDTEENDDADDANTDIMANIQNVVLLGMMTADLVDIGYKDNRSQNQSELVDCVLKQVDRSTGGKKMETNLGRDTLRVMMVMNQPSVGSVHTVSLVDVSDVKYNKNHISCNFTDSRRFVQKLKDHGFGANGNKIDFLIMDYYWFQSVRMQ